MSQAAVLTMAYAEAKAGRDVSYRNIEREAAAMTPEAKRLKVQSALNDQVHTPGMLRSIDR